METQVLTLTTGPFKPSLQSKTKNVVTCAEGKSTPPLITSKVEHTEDLTIRCAGIYA